MLFPENLMTILRFRLFVLGAAFLFLSVPAPRVRAQAPPGALPKELSALMPTGASQITGTWNRAGTLGMGQASGEVKGTSTCDGKPGAGTVQIEVLSQSRQGPTLAMYEQSWQQKFTSAKSSLANDASTRKQAPLNVSVSAVKEETVAGGSIAYFDYTDGCVQSPKPNHATAALKGVAQHGGVFVEFSIVIPGTATEARALAAEVLGNIQKTDFSSLSAK